MGNRGGSNSSSRSRNHGRFYDTEGVGLEEIEPFKLTRICDAALMNAFYNLLKGSTIKKMIEDNMANHTIATLSMIEENLQRNGENMLAFFPF